MKKLLLVSALVSTNALADPSVLLQVIIPPFIYESSREDKAPEERQPMEVVATGVGKTCDQALENAKVAAVEKVSGLWMTAQRHTDGEKYNESITDYTGGVIKSYTIVSNECTKVTIDAQVVPRTNKIVSGGADVSQQTRGHLQEKIANEKKRLVAIQEVNNRNKAIAFDIKDIELIPSKMSVTGEVFFQEKWKHDYYDLKKQAGKFTLDSFHKPIYVNVKGYNVGKEVFNQQYQLNYDQWVLYQIQRDGDVTIYPDRKDTIKLTFPVDSGRIMTVDKFEVSLL
jgi:hypothetical protein